MKHIGTIGFIALSVLSFGLGRAEQERRVPTIGLVWFTNPALAKPFDEAFRDGLRTLGYMDGKNISILARYAQGDGVRSDALVRELVALHVDLMVVNAKADAQQCKQPLPSPLCAPQSEIRCRKA